jgi:hypothetical protein
MSNLSVVISLNGTQSATDVMLRSQLASHERMMIMAQIHKTRVASTTVRMFFYAIHVSIIFSTIRVAFCRLWFVLLIRSRNVLLATFVTVPSEWARRPVQWVVGTTKPV